MLYSIILKSKLKLRRLNKCIFCVSVDRISDTTDYIPYKAHLIPDQDLFDYFDEIDKIISNVGISLKEKEYAMMKIRDLSNEYTKIIYQCQKCGNIFLEHKSTTLEMFRGCNEKVNMELLESVKGDKWQGFLYAEWVDNKPICLEKKGYISAPTLIKEEYERWEELEARYYIIFNELKEKNILRSSSLRKNNITIHSWNL